MGNRPKPEEQQLQLGVCIVPKKEKLKLQRKNLFYIPHGTWYMGFSSISPAPRAFFSRFTVG